MTHRERFIRTLKWEPIGGQVPTFELVFYLTMEAFGKIHHEHRKYFQWKQMSYAEQKLHMDEIAQLYVDIAKRYGHSAIFVQGDGNAVHHGNIDGVQWLLELIREKCEKQLGGQLFIMMHGDPTWSIPDGESMMDFAVKMYEEPEVLNEESQRRLDFHVDFAQKLDAKGHLLDGFALCADYCFNVNPFFSQDMFEELIVPYLKGSIDAYRSMGYYSIKHTDGNIMPILKQMADCKPDAFHSLDPQGGVKIPEVRRVVGEDICLIGNVNCGLLQTGSDEACRADVLRSLREGMANGRGYVFSTSNCAYTGMPLARYEMLNDLWRKYGNYEDYEKNFGK